MKEIYGAIKTPYKYGAVLKKEGFMTDSPVVFKYKNGYCMTYICIDVANANGYRTFIARSNDLIKWEDIGEILTEKCEWDSAQTGGYAQMQDIRFGGTNELLKVGGKYIVSFLGGNHKGYETDPLSMGLAVADDLLDIKSYRKLPRPILSGQDKDARKGETLTIFKGNMFYDESEITGHPYVCVYNARDNTYRESIFTAVSDDGMVWQRYLDKAIIPVTECDKSVNINGDPQIVLINGYYVMLYFIADKIKGTYNTFAVSKDFKKWTKWTGEPLMKSEYAWENVHAHKQWTIKENGIVYQYYCAVNDKGERFIALATSEPLYQK